MVSNDLISQIFKKRYSEFYMGIFTTLINKEDRKNFFDYFLYIFRKPGIERNHLNRILIESFIYNILYF